MDEGEAWIFDNFREHMVENGGDETRVHLVVDTLGSPAFWRLVERASDPWGSSPVRSAELIPFRPEQQAAPEIEKYAFQVMSPTEVDELLEAVLAAARARVDTDRWNEANAWIRQFRNRWRGLAERYGQSDAGLAAYNELLSRAEQEACASPTLSDPSGFNLVDSRAFRVIVTQCVIANGAVTRQDDQSVES